MENNLQRAFDELKREAALKKRKKKSALKLPKEKRLAYYSGWHKDDEPVSNVS
ncbi:hypothetical protein HYU14_04495 [Candidatus Woesearchaeota archaeon]|nr:hypothetical protein [Candidatus Woesearchaeota archaeon]